MSTPGRVVTDSMIGLKMPDYSRIITARCDRARPESESIYGTRHEHLYSGHLEAAVSARHGPGRRDIRRPARSGAQGTLRQYRTRTNRPDSCARRSPGRRAPGDRKIRRDGSIEDAVGGPRCSRGRDFRDRPRRRSSHRRRHPARGIYSRALARSLVLLFGRRARIVHGGRCAGRRYYSHSRRYWRPRRVHGFAQALARARSRDDLSRRTARSSAIPKRRSANTSLIANCANARCSRRSRTVRDRSKRWRS